MIFKNECPKCREIIPILKLNGSCANCKAVIKSNKDTILSVCIIIWFFIIGPIILSDFMHVLHERSLLSGFGRGGEWRRDQGLPRGGPAAVITTLWVLRFDPVSREAHLAQVHPGVSPDEVRENTGWALPVSTQLAVPPSPARGTEDDPGV